MAHRAVVLEVRTGDIELAARRDSFQAHLSTECRGGPECLPFQRIGQRDRLRVCAAVARPSGPLR
jgi:hypothetical protein